MPQSFFEIKVLIKIHNCGTFHLYSICNCEVINFQMFSWQCSIHEIAPLGSFLGPNSPKCCQILLKFLPELVIKETQTVFKEFWKNSIFYETGDTQNLHVWSNFDPLFPPWRWPKLRKIKKIQKKVQPSGYPNMQM